MLKKLLIGGVLLIGLGVALSPVAGGVLTERLFSEYAQSQPRLFLAPGLALELGGEYESGLLTSTLRTRISTASGPAGTSLVHRIHHGPIPYLQLESGLALAVIETQLVDDADQSPLPVRMKTVVGLDRSVRISLDGESVNRPGLELDGVRGRLETSAAGGRIVGSLDLETLRIDSPSYAIDVGRTEIAIDSRTSDTVVPLGDLRVALARASVKSPPLGLDLRVRDLRVDQHSEGGPSAITTEGTLSLGELFAIEGGQAADGALAGPQPGLLLREVKLSSEGALDRAGSTLEVRAPLRIAEIETASATGSFQARNVELELEVRGLDAEAAGDLLTTRADLATLTRVAPRLLGASPQIRISNGRAETTRGAVALDLDLRGRPDMANLPMTSPLALLTAVDLRADVEMSELHFDQLAVGVAESQTAGLRVAPRDRRTVMTLAQAFQQKMLDAGYVEIVDLGGERRYRARVEYERATLKINDRPVDPLALAMPGLR